MNEWVSEYVIGVAVTAAHWNDNWNKHTYTVFGYHHSEAKQSKARVFVYIYAVPFDRALIKNENELSIILQWSR